MKRFTFLIVTCVVAFAEVTTEDGLAFQNESPLRDDGVTEPLALAQVRTSRHGGTLDHAFWSSIKDSNNPADFRAYLAAFPIGDFAEEARARSEAAQVITPTTQAARPTPDIAVVPRVLRSRLPRANPPAVFYDIARESENKAEAAELYRLAAEAGDVRGAIELAALYERGAGVPQSVEDALQWYRFAADRGNARGQHNLARLYEEGLGVERNMEEALHFYGLAADQGLQLATTALRRLVAPVGASTSRAPTTAPVENSVLTRCADILISAQLGELSERNRIFLQEECGQ